MALGWDASDNTVNGTGILSWDFGTFAAMMVALPTWRALFYFAATFSLGLSAAWFYERRSRLREMYDLFATRQRVDLAVESADLGLWEWRASDDSIWLSERSRDLLGITTTGDIAREFFLDHIHPGDRPDFEHRFQMLSPENPRFELETRVSHSRTREVRWLSSRGRAHFDEQGNMDRLFGASIDCTAQKHAQALEEQQRNQITHLTRIATLGQLAGSLAHEITQPLTAMLSNAQTACHHLAKSKIDVGELKSILDDIIADDRRASEIIHRLRAMARKATPQFTEVLPLDVIKESISLLHGELLQRNVTLVLTPKTNLLSTRADRVQLQQVLLNLLLNAADAVTGSAAAQRVIEVTAENEENSAIKITIADHGPGFTAQQLSTSFEPFQSSKPQGLGIGLWISRMIMESHGGQILLANRPEGGARVTILLPLSNMTQPAPAHA